MSSTKLFYSKKNLGALSSSPHSRSSSSLSSQKQFWVVGEGFSHVCIECDYENRTEERKELWKNCSCHSAAKDEWFECRYNMYFTICNLRASSLRGQFIHTNAFSWLRASISQIYRIFFFSEMPIGVIAWETEEGRERGQLDPRFEIRWGPCHAGKISQANCSVGNLLLW